MSYFDDNEDEIIYGRNLRRRVAASKARDEKECPKCGACPLKLRLNDNGNWQLFEQERGEHNRNTPHNCNPCTEDDFEDVSADA
jgi:ribosomal protein L37AE/L43A